MNNNNIITIKNMVCPRCIKVVREELEKLGLTIETISLGTVILNQNLDQNLRDKISEVLEENGFELLENEKAKLIERIKVEIIDVVQKFETVELENFNISNFLSKNFEIDYPTMSSLFSKTVGITVEHFFILQKIEKVKELLRYNEFTLSEIAYKLGYSSVQHLSNQFRKSTGMTASQFKKDSDNLRKSIDSIIK